MGLLDRLKAADYVANPAQQEELPTSIAGRVAEEHLFDTFRRIPGVRVFQGLRIKDPKSNYARREVDIVAACRSALLVIEVKNWSGEVRDRGDGHWEQHQRDGRVVTHEDPTTLNWQKAKALKAYLEAQGCQVPELKARVVFLNERLNADASVRGNEGVFIGDAWKGAFSYELGWMNAVVKFLGSKRLPDASFRKLVSCLQGVPTWDVLAIEGGRVYSGDFKGFGNTEVGRLLHRGYFYSVKLQHCRSKFVNYAGAAFGQTPSVRVRVRKYKDRTKNERLSTDWLNLGPGDTLSFRVAGSNAPHTFVLNDVLKISFCTTKAQ